MEGDDRPWLIRYLDAGGHEAIPDGQFVAECADALGHPHRAGDLTRAQIDRLLWLLQRDDDLVVWDVSLPEEEKCACRNALPVFLARFAPTIDESLDGLTYFWDSLLAARSLALGGLRDCVERALDTQRQIPNPFIRISAEDGLRLLAEADS